MRPVLKTEQVIKIRKAKLVLRNLLEQSGLKHKYVMERLVEAGFEIKKSTFANWFGTADNNLHRPPEDVLAPLVRIFLQNQSQISEAETLEQLCYLLGYRAPVLKTSEEILSQLSAELEWVGLEQLEHRQNQLQIYIDRLDQLLSKIEPLVMDFDKGAPVIRIPYGEGRQVTALTGKKGSELQQYRTSEGYEVPLTHIQSLDILSEIINQMNEGIHILRTYVENLLMGADEISSACFQRVEDFVSYTWEISDRLLYNNFLCRSNPLLRKTLLRMMATCQGIRYLLQSQEGNYNFQPFKAILSHKGDLHSSEINCAVAVYTGIIARQIIKTFRSPNSLQQGLQLFEKSRNKLERCAQSLSLEEDRYFFLKELANLYHDIASLMLTHQEHLPHIMEQANEWMGKAAFYYDQVLSEPNAFTLGLNPPRLLRLQSFRLMAKAWVCSDPETVLSELSLIQGVDDLSGTYWVTMMSQAIVWGILALRFDAQLPKAKEQAWDALRKASLVTGLSQRTEQEIQNDFVLKSLFSNKNIKVQA
ncbi:hypothetical protein COW36_21740 [bacterium (Candidatus Blackallbacteria) CG17_big_fil_post_rev_8_21_14_2_50_48_46]|uniref:Uncharacterized protein n=1 Tax=bacterium (Candidatus Blackallbacteria) CG17_big_fil_post_rev_8_21_14_2_50_48_46 TaxID=2014261 RepID=A0A2M7FYH1_9BACT|nr:MAG: hypothetical protein COW64_11120 [bacterium (Candidatus Blackallbacteria) CG18_big_fil_WC_8_21_14_2_50_49_26]PIW14392.1 MAG: hypothetical protein COW36_21740 [bacterium (Candidatus Blackallbacteria) CG17_big_fil_post_rev_8_21_14_2_50_48_46]PIW46899.1 MAG: hypothetical protein COW20_14155 [bacterium (Candidatus Blackallbacteria) CG13_big_fil_rev_8_21_14_2_50_49_14]